MYPVFTKIVKAILGWNTRWGLCLYKTKQDKFIQFNVSGSNNRSIASNEVFDIEEDFGLEHSTI